PGSPDAAVEATASLAPSVSTTALADQIARLFRGAVSTATQTAQAAAAGAASGIPSSPVADDASSLTFGVSTGSASSAFGGSGAGGAAPATADHAALSAAIVLLSRGGAVDDDLPAVPVYATDVSPD
ncbi:hypothetical protein DBR36_10390, partial [Microbacterium sp. HMWF026]